VESWGTSVTTLIRGIVTHTWYCRISFATMQPKDCEHVLETMAVKLSTTVNTLKEYNINVLN